MLPQMKKHFQDVVLPLTRLSGIQWTPENGVAINNTTPHSVRDVWNDYTKVRDVSLASSTIMIGFSARFISQQRNTQKATHSIMISSSWCQVMQRGREPSMDS
jgi:hypothetical protein